MKNAKHKTNSFDSFNSWSKKQTYSLPFREGLGVGFLTPFLSGRGPGVGFSPRKARLILKISVPSVPGVSGVSFRFWTKKTPVFGPNRNKTGVSGVSSVSSVSSVPHPYSLPFREGPGVGFFPHQARSVANLISYWRFV